MQQTKPTTDAPAWTAPDLANPHVVEDKPDRVRRMFASIATRYDLNNRLHSMWRDQAWRRCAVRLAHVQSGDIVVDLACGTGDLTELFATTGAARVIGLDFTPEMLALAERKRSRLRPEVSNRIEYARGDATDLDLDDNCADVVSIAFGLRNVADPGRCLDEIARVLKPGGRLVILEFAEPSIPPVRWFNTVFCRWIMPVTATIISGDRSGAYRYLPASVGTFPHGQALRDLVAAHGFSDVRTRPLSLGICACLSATLKEPDSKLE